MMPNYSFTREFFTTDGLHRLLLVALRPDESSAIYIVEGPPAELSPRSRSDEVNGPKIRVMVRFVEVGPGLVGPSLLEGEFLMSFTDWNDVLMWPGELRLRNRDED